MPKSTRHSKIVGDFGESLMLYLLSKKGYECSIIDHTGIDIVAYDKSENTRIGISVKSRTRTKNTQHNLVEIANSAKRNGDIEKIEKACEAFDCIPYFAIVVDNPFEKVINCYLVSKNHFLEEYDNGTKNIRWLMSKKMKQEYEQDEKVECFKFDYKPASSTSLISN